MRRTISYAFLLAGLLLAACSGSSAGGSNGEKLSPPPASPPTAKLTVTDPSGGAGPFAIAGLDKLVIAVDASHFRPGQHAVRLDVTGPSGALYSQLPASLAVADDGTGHATAALQVRGSLIESFHDAGNWQLVAHVDGAPVASASIDLTR
jgi:hypothetical protein